MIMFLFAFLILESLTLFPYRLGTFISLNLTEPLLHLFPKRMKPIFRYFQMKTNETQHASIFKGIFFYARPPAPESLSNFYHLFPLSCPDKYSFNFFFLKLTP
jgi:hypothetical protein